MRESLALVLALVGFLCLPVGLLRILLGALGRQERTSRVRSGMSLLSAGVFLLLLGVVLHPNHLQSLTTP